MTRIADLSRVLQLQKRLSSLDAEGRVQEQWVTYDRVRANVQPLTATELILAQQASSEVTHQVIVRWRKDLAYPPVPGGPQLGHNLRFLEYLPDPAQPPRVLDIKGIVNTDEADVYLRLLCTELQTV